MANFAVTYYSETASSAISPSKWQTNYGEIVLGLTDGLKDITVANAEVKDDTEPGHMVVESSVTAAHGYCENTCTVSGLVEGSRYTIQFMGRAQSFTPTYPALDVYGYRGGSYWSVLDLVGTSTTGTFSYVRSASTFSAGDYMLMVMRSATPGNFCFFDVGPPEVVVGTAGNSAIVVTFPRSGSVLNWNVRETYSNTADSSHVIWTGMVEVVFDT